MTASDIMILKFLSVDNGVFLKDDGVFPQGGPMSVCAVHLAGGPVFRRTLALPKR